MLLLFLLLLLLLMMITLTKVFNVIALKNYELFPNTKASAFYVSLAFGDEPSEHD